MEKLQRGAKNRKIEENIDLLGNEAAREHHEPVVDHPEGLSRERAGTPENQAVVDDLDYKEEEKKEKTSI